MLVSKKELTSNIIMIFYNKGRAGKGGFTLIELLVVIAIIGVLASIVLASLNSARRKSRDTRRVADVNQIRLALELYFDANTSYPVALADLTSGCGGQPCMPSVPDDPQSNAYAYEAITSASTLTTCSADCTYYHLGANLEEDATSGQTGGNPALANDRDLDGPSWSGMTSDCTGTTAAADDGCYDVTP